MRLSIPTIIAIGFLTPALAADGPHQKIAIKGAVEKPAEWSAEEIAKEFAADVKEVTFTLKGRPAKARVFPLLKLVQTAKPKVDPKQKNHLLAFTVVVRGKDGYTAAFSLGELLPEYGGASVFIALDRDGKPLPETEMPVSILVPGDKKPSRWVHAVTSISVIDSLAFPQK